MPRGRRRIRPGSAAARSCRSPALLTIMPIAPRPFRLPRPQARHPRTPLCSTVRLERRLRSQLHPTGERRAPAPAHLRSQPMPTAMSPAITGRSEFAGDLSPRSVADHSEPLIVEGGIEPYRRGPTPRRTFVASATTDLPANRAVPGVNPFAPPPAPPPGTPDPHAMFRPQPTLRQRPNPQARDMKRFRQRQRRPG